MFRINIMFLITFALFTIVSCGPKPSEDFYIASVRTNLIVYQGFKIANYNYTSLNPIVITTVDDYLEKYKKYSRSSSVYSIIKMHHSQIIRGNFQVGLVDVSGQEEISVKSTCNKTDEIIDEEIEKYGFTVDKEVIFQEVEEMLKKENGSSDTRVR